MKFLTPEEIKVKKIRQKWIMYFTIFILMIGFFAGVTFLTYSI
ncbi:hypothetical protein [Bacillus sp. AK031]